MPKKRHDIFPITSDIGLIATRHEIRRTEWIYSRIILFNIRAFESAHGEFHDIPNVGVIFCDVNGLKTTNDTPGHAAGDELLQRFSELLKKHFSLSEIFRIRGGEFVIPLPNVKEDEFMSAVDNLKKTIVEQQDIASVGYASVKGSTVPDLVSRVEKDMYTDIKSYYGLHCLNRRRT